MGTGHALSTSSFDWDDWRLETVHLTPLMLQ